MRTGFCQNSGEVRAVRNYKNERGMRKGEKSHAR